MSNPSDRFYKALAEPVPQTCVTPDEITRYIGRDMSVHERRIVENHLIECGLCSDAVEGAMKMASPQDARQRTMSVNRRIKAQMSKERATPFSMGSARMYYSVAAMLLLTLSGIAYWATRSPYEKVFADYMKPYSNSIPLVRGENTLTPLQDAMMSYEAEDYDMAAQKLQAILTKDPENETVRFYGGISCLMAGRSEEAIALLQPISSRFEAHDASEWYLAMAFLKNRDFTKAGPLFENIAVRQGPYTESAKRLLEQLK